MKKIILSMIGLMAATAFAPQASAVPAFARQTGMGCNACHQQHFPVLNSFGRAFKADGFTMVGSQAMLEEEHLSLPATLNAGILLKAQYRMTNGKDKVYTKTGNTNLDGSAADDQLITTNDGKWMVPDEFGLFFGGRLADTGTLKVGTMIEHSMDNLVGFRIPVVVDMGGVKLSAIPFLTDALGPFYGYTESSTGLNRAVRWNEHHADISAHRFIGLATDAASGVTLLAKADMGYVAYTQWANAFPMADQSLSLNLVHVGWTPTFAGWDMVVTAEMVSGESKEAIAAGTTTGDVFAYDPTTGGSTVTPGTVVADAGTFAKTGREYNASGFTVQAHGAFGDMPAGIYATYANAPKTDATGTTVNAYNTATAYDKTAMTVGVDVSVIPHVLSVGGAYRTGQTGKKTVLGNKETDDAISINMNYDIAQNMGIQITHSMYSGSKYDDKVQAAGDTQTSILLETAW